MKKNLTLLASSIIIALIFAAFQPVHSMEEPGRGDEGNLSTQFSQTDWSSAIETTFQSVIKLEGNKLTYGVLDQTLTTMDNLYVGDERKEFKLWRNAKCEAFDETENFNEFMNFHFRGAPSDLEIQSTKHVGQVSRNILIRHMKEMVKKYDQLTGTPHPLSPTITSLFFVEPKKNRALNHEVQTVGWHLNNEQEVRILGHSVIPETIRHLEKLNTNQLTYEVLTQILISMDEFYVNDEEKRELNLWRNSMCEDFNLKDFEALIKLHMNFASDRTINANAVLAPLYRSILMRHIKAMVKKYTSRSGLKHDLSEYFGHP